MENEILCELCLIGPKQLHCKKCYAARARKRRRDNRKNGFCSCGRPKLEGDGFKCEWCRNWRVRYNKEAGKERTAQWREKNKDKLTEQTKARGLEQKKAVFAAYGGQKCSCPGGCEVVQLEFLSLDHIHGGGSQHRLEVKNVYRWAIKNSFPPGFRILCMNCNFSLGKFGYCPHEKERETVVKTEVD